MQKLLIVFVLLFTVLITYTVDAQRLGRSSQVSEDYTPSKIQKAVLDPLPAGTYTIGSGGYFPTIDSAFNKLSIDGIAGSVTLELIDEVYTAPATAYGFSLSGPIPGAGPNSRVTIKPTEGMNVLIQGSGRDQLTAINTSYVTIDGVSLTGSTTLTVYAHYNNQFNWNAGIDFIDNSDHNILRNMTFLSDDIDRGGGGPGLYTRAGINTVADSNIIENNFIKKCGVGGIYLAFDNASSRGTGNVIRGNLIGSEMDSLLGWGIQVEHALNTIIENNIIQNLKHTPSQVTEILNLGINSYSGTGDIIRNNIVHSINASSGYTSTGIMLSGGSGINNTVYNNMVYDIQSTSTQSNSRVAGIQIWNQANPKIYYNTVYLSGSGSNQSGSAAFYVFGGFGNSTGVDVKNNIFVNTRDESQYFATSVYDYSVSNMSSDYNALYSANSLVRIGSTNYNSLADWQVTSKDLNSINEIVNFISPTDLHINNNFNTLLNDRATPITEVSTDLDGELRSTTNPDIGADEFDLSSSTTNWQPQNLNFPTGIMVEDLSAPNDMVCWAVGVDAVLSAPYAGFSRTTDGGNTWVCDTIAENWTGIIPTIFAIDENIAFAASYVPSGGDSKGIYKTTDGGLTWNRQNAYNNSLYGAGYIHFFDSQNGVAIGDPNLETYTTTDGGDNWNSVTMPAALSEEYTWNSGNGITAYGNTIWFSTGARVFKSYDKGNTWNVILSEPQYLLYWPCIAFQDVSIGIYSLKQQGQLDHIYRKTTDGGATWTTLSNQILDNLAPTGMQYIEGKSTFIVSGGMPQGMRGIAVTYDGGDSWTLIDTIGHTFIEFPSEMVGWGSEYNTSEVSKYVGPKIITTVEEEIVDIVPTGYSLSQNYPNPFNPSTTIRYSIPTQSRVTIKIFDLLGKEVEILVNGEKPTGTYELKWNAVNLPSGVYFYRIQAGDYMAVKKMLLIK